MVWNMPFRGLLKLGYHKYGYQTDMSNIWKITWNRLCLRNFLFWDDPFPSSSSNKPLPTVINGSSLIVERSYGKPQCLNPAYHPTKLAWIKRISVIVIITAVVAPPYLSLLHLHISNPLTCQVLNSTWCVAGFFLQGPRGQTMPAR